MKKFYLRFVLFFCATTAFVNAQILCTGTPGSNTVLPMSYTICQGSAASMSLANTYSTVGIYYQWQSSTISAVGPFSSIPGATLSSYTSGSLQSTTYYNVVITCTYSGQSISVPNTVSVVTCSNNCIPNANFTLTPSGTPQLWNVIPASTVNVASAQWTWGDGTSSNTLFTSHQYSAAGMYSICLSVTLTCNATASSCASYSVYKNAEGFVQVNVIGSALVNIEESNQALSNLRLYPNPSNGMFFVEVPNYKGASSFEIRNVVGQLVYSGQEETSATGLKTFDLSALMDGIYFVKVTQGNNSRTAKITIQK